MIFMLDTMVICYQYRQYIDGDNLLSSIFVRCTRKCFATCTLFSCNSKFSSFGFDMCYTLLLSNYVIHEYSYLVYGLSRKT